MYMVHRSWESRQDIVSHSMTATPSNNDEIRYNILNWNICSNWFVDNLGEKYCEMCDQKIMWCLTSYPCLHLHTALLPVEVQSAFTPHGSWYIIECIIISCLLYLGSSKLSTNPTCEQGSALQRTKGSPVYPGGHLQMARLPAHSY